MTNGFLTLTCCTIYADRYFDAHDPMLSKRRDRNARICVFQVDSCVRAKHYGFTEVELDFIPSTVLGASIEYGIRCRMGQGSEQAEE